MSKLNPKIRNRFYLLASVFLTIVTAWIIQRTFFLAFIPLSLGLIVGSLVLDFDPLISAYIYHRPEIIDTIKNFFSTKKFLSIFDYLWQIDDIKKSTIFHNVIFQIGLFIVSIFTFTSTTAIFAKSILLGLNIHLLMDELNDFRQNPEILARWLFSSLDKPVKPEFIKYFLYFTILFNIIIVVLITKH